MSFDVDEVLGRLTLEEKAGLTVGHGAWRVAPIGRLGIPGLTVADGPHGVRKQAKLDNPARRGTLPATCFPTASLLGATWDTALVERVAAEREAMGEVLVGSTDLAELGRMFARLTDAHNGLRALNRTAAGQLHLRQNGMAHASEIIEQLGRSRLRWAEHPVHIRFTEYSMAKGQSVLNAVNILTDLIYK